MWFRHGEYLNYRRRKPFHWPDLHQEFKKARTHFIPVHRPPKSLLANEFMGIVAMSVRTTTSTVQHVDLELVSPIMSKCHVTFSNATSPCYSHTATMIYAYRCQLHFVCADAETIFFKRI